MIVLTMTELKEFDPNGPLREQERRFFCPLPECAGKPRTKGRRSLAVDMQTGLWICHRCQASGKLKEFWEERASSFRSERQRAQARLAQRTTLSRPVQSSPPSDTEWKAKLNLLPLPGSPAARYLEERGIPEALAKAAGVKYQPDFYGRPAVMFSCRDREGKLVAAQGRHIDGRDDPKLHNCGPTRQGVFATPGAWEADPIILVESPINALSLAHCGFPAIALFGAGGGPDWLPEALAFKRVVIAFDNDANGAGDKGAEKLKAALRAVGCRVDRLTPQTNDVNDLLQQYGQEALTNSIMQGLRELGLLAPVADQAANEETCLQEKTEETLAEKAVSDTPTTRSVSPRVEETLSHEELAAMIGGCFDPEGEGEPSSITGPCPDRLPVSREQLEAVASFYPGPEQKKTPQRQYNNSSFDLEAWIVKHDLHVRKSKTWKGGIGLVLDVCPFNPAHNCGKAFLYRHSTGPVGFRCQKASCSNNDWHALQDILEPDWVHGHIAPQVSQPVRGVGDQEQNLIKNPCEDRIDPTCYPSIV